MAAGSDNTRSVRPERTSHGTIAVFRWPLWLIRWRITSSRLASGSSRLTKTRGRDVSPLQTRFERLPDVRRRVMEARLAGDFRVVQQRRIETAPWLSLGQPPKKFTVPPRRTILTAQCQVCGLPTASIAISDAASVRHLADRASPGCGMSAVRRSARRRPARRGAIKLRLAPPDRDHAAAIELRPASRTSGRSGPRPDDGDGIARRGAGLFQAADHASQRLHQRRVLIADVLRESDTCCAPRCAPGMRMYSA